MERYFRKQLLEWKNHPLRTPLIVRGARQVGKTFEVQAFGIAEFKNIVTINFEVNPECCACFEKMEPASIIKDIEFIIQKKIILGETLLFLDEIQECPKALQALRYFKEQLPGLHLIAAGSLLEFAIHDEDFSFPVGRVQFARMYPLSFEEYLVARGDRSLVEVLHSFTLKNRPTVAVHHYLLAALKEYFVIGGMPAAIMAYLKTKSFLEVSYVHQALLAAFKSDFGKYAKKTQHKHLNKIFSEVPVLLGEHIKYSRINPELPNPAREIKQAMELLKLAGLLHPIHATSAGSLPLLAGIKENIFKLLFLDIGLVGQAMDIGNEYSGAVAGPLAEQFVGQELLATADPRLDTSLFFWTRKEGSAEVDYLFPYRGIVYPIEVKAGKSGKLKSLHLFMREKNSSFGIKISQEALNLEGNILSVPLYMVPHLPRLINLCM